MKKTTVFFLSAIAMFVLSCGGVGDKMAEQITPSWDATDPLSLAAARIAYMEQMYTPDKGKAINDSAMSSVPEEYKADVQAKLDSSLAYPGTDKTGVHWYESLNTGVASYIAEKNYTSDGKLPRGIVEYYSKEDNYGQTKLGDLLNVTNAAEIKTNEIKNEDYEALCNLSETSTVLAENGTLVGSSLTSQLEKIDKADSAWAENAMALEMAGAVVDFFMNGGASFSFSGIGNQITLDSIKDDLSQIKKMLKVIGQKLEEIDTNVKKVILAVFVTDYDVRYSNALSSRTYYYDTFLSQIQSFYAIPDFVSLVEYLKNKLIGDEYADKMNQAYVSAYNAQKLVKGTKAGEAESPYEVLQSDHGVRVYFTITTTWVNEDETVSYQYVTYPGLTANIKLYPHIMTLSSLNPRDIELIKRYSLSRIELFNEVYQGSQLAKARKFWANNDYGKFNTIYNSIIDDYTGIVNKIQNNDFISTNNYVGGYGLMASSIEGYSVLTEISDTIRNSYEIDKVKVSIKNNGDEVLLKNYNATCEFVHVSGFGISRLNDVYVKISSQDQAELNAIFQAEVLKNAKAKYKPIMTDVLASLTEWKAILDAHANVQ
jgi:hypothetical protein